MQVLCQPCGEAAGSVLTWMAARMLLHCHGVLVNTPPVSLCFPACAAAGQDNLIDSMVRSV